METSRTKRRGGYKYVPRHRVNTSTEQPKDNHQHGDHQHGDHNHSDHQNGTNQHGDHHHSNDNDQHKDHQNQVENALLEHANHPDTSMKNEHGLHEHGLHEHGHGHHHQPSMNNTTNVMDYMNKAMNSTQYFNMPNDINVTTAMMNRGGHDIHHHPAHHGHVHNATMPMVHNDNHMDHMASHEDHMGHMEHDDHHQMNMGNMMMGGHHGMHMGGPHFIIEGLKISSIEGIVTAMVFTMVLTIFLEFLSLYLHLRERHRKLSTDFTAKNCLFHGLTAMVHMLKLGSAYILMLCVMSMNIWILVSIVLGSGIGYLFIRPFAEAIQAKSFTIDSKEIHVTVDGGNEESLVPDKSEKTTEHTQCETDAFIT